PDILDVPKAGGRTKDGDISLPIAVVVGGHGDIAQEGAMLDGWLSLDIPGAVGWTEDGKVDPAIAIVVGRYGDIASLSPGKWIIFIGSNITVWTLWASETVIGGVVD